MKKVLLINSSYRKKTTFSVLKRIETELISHGIETEWLHLSEYELQPCRGCEVCIMRGTCVIQDSFFEVEQKLKGADGIILSSPVYLRQVSGVLKTMIDRTCSHYHRPILVGKPIFSTVTTNASGAKETLKYLKDITIQWGAIPAGRLAVKLAGVEQAVLEKKIDRFCMLLESPKELDRPNWKRVMDFQVQKVLALQVLLQDRPYWEHEGWDQRDYFYENQLSWIKKKVGHIFYQFLAGKMKKK
ncbi:hypothetical protein SANA_19670 [Gottschalkiaceae bacterium SANA]|nr:hypothetical protein SANA_19670 [Gottschalkiaceae bacterium SANA]